MTIRSRLTAFAASAALVAAGIAPARAEPDARDIIGLLATFAAIAAIANAEGKAPPPPTYQPPTYQPPTYQPPTYHPPVPPPQPYPYPHPHPHPPPPPVAALPAQCLIKVHTKYGWERAYDADCLWRSGYRRALPQHCVRDHHHGNGRWQRAYADHCLRRDND